MKPTQEDRNVIPPRNHPMWRDLVTGKVQHRFSSPGAGLLMTRMRRSAEADPSAHNISERIEEARMFFARFEPLLAQDIEHLFK